MQEIIVYRNPMEAALWNVLMSHGFEIVVFIVIFFLVFVTLNHLGEKFYSRRDLKMNRYNMRKQRDLVQTLSIIISVVCSTIGVLVILPTLF